ncbi:unnamed protein product [Linum tenue]|uniref:Band 7 domain-containing protein n=1 Tax=Linum tenue TaxID=586396 RepID=A0AAV0Q9K7_9ROSI|nr:unnamed protein product [Linum tenue]
MWRSSSTRLVKQTFRFRQQAAAVLLDSPKLPTLFTITAPISTSSAPGSISHGRQSSLPTLRSPLTSPFSIVPVRHIRSIRDASTSAITKDNVSILIDGVLYVKIVDPKLASYGVENPIYAVIQLAQTTMRSELGKITLDKTFEERDTLNEKIVEAINVAASDWGLQCLRYEIRDINPPRGVRVAMEMQAEAERKKRAQVLESEGERQANINIADGRKLAAILSAEGEAQAILAKADATAKGITLVSKTLKESGGVEAASLKVAEQYIHAFGNIAKEGTTVLLPSSTANPASMIAQALTVYKSLLGKTPNAGEGSSPSLELSGGVDKRFSIEDHHNIEGNHVKGESGFSLQKNKGE